MKKKRKKEKKGNSRNFKWLITSKKEFLFFPQLRLITSWDSLPREAVEAPAVEPLKTKLSTGVRACCRKPQFEKGALGIVLNSLFNLSSAMLLWPSSSEWIKVLKTKGGGENIVPQYTSKSTNGKRSAWHSQKTCYLQSASRLIRHLSNSEILGGFIEYAYQRSQAARLFSWKGNKLQKQGICFSRVHVHAFS